MAQHPPRYQMVYVPQEAAGPGPTPAPPVPYAPARTRRRWVVWGLLAVAGGVLAWQGLRRLPVDHHLWTPATPWWSGGWAAEAGGTPALALELHGRVITGSVTFRLTDGFLCQRPLLWARADDNGLVFALGGPLWQGYECYLMAPEGPGRASLYRLRNLAQAQALAGGQAVLIPTQPETAHTLIARLVRPGPTPARLAPPAPSNAPPAAEGDGHAP